MPASALCVLQGPDGKGDCRGEEVRDGEVQELPAGGGEAARAVLGVPGAGPPAEGDEAEADSASGGAAAAVVTTDNRETIMSSETIEGLEQETEDKAAEAKNDPEAAPAPAEPSWGDVAAASTVAEAASLASDRSISELAAIEEARERGKKRQRVERMTKKLRVEPDEKETRALKNEMARVLNRQADIESQKSLAVSGFNRQLKEIKKSLAALTLDATLGIEKLVPCIKRKDELGNAWWIREDTGEHIDEPGQQTLPEKVETVDVDDVEPSVGDVAESLPPGVTEKMPDLGEGATVIAAGGQKLVKKRRGKKAANGVATSVADGGDAA